MKRPLEEAVREVEEAIGKPIVLRAIHTPEQEVRGRISSQAGYLLLEYRDETAGYFWHHDIIRELLELVRQGCRDLVVYDWNMVVAPLVDKADGEMPDE